MANNRITKIEIYPQIFLYAESYVVNRLDTPTVNEEIKGAFFGFNIVDGTASFNENQLNPFAPDSNALKLTILNQESSEQSMRINIDYAQFINEILFNPAVLTLIGDTYFFRGVTISLNWVSKAITRISGANIKYLIPRPTSNGILLPIRVRFFYKITFEDDGESQFVMTFPNVANGSYETVFNADKPYRFFEFADDEAGYKGYTPNSWRLFNNDGEEISSNIELDGTLSFNAGNSNGAYLLLTESILGCKTNELMDQQARVDSVVKLNGNTILQPITDFTGLPVVVANEINNNWIFTSITGNPKNPTASSIYDIFSSFVRVHCYRLEINSVMQNISAKFLDVRSSEEIEMNGLLPATIIYDLTAPILTQTNEDGLYFSLSENAGVINAKIDCDGCAVPFTAITETITYRIFSRGTTLSSWTTRTVSDKVTANLSVSNGAYLQREIIKLDIDNLCTLCGLEPADAAKVLWEGMITVSYSGIFNSSALVLPTLTSYFLIGSGTPSYGYALSNIALNVNSGNWNYTTLTAFIYVWINTTMTYGIIKSLITKILFIKDCVRLSYQGNVIGREIFSNNNLIPISDSTCNISMSGIYAMTITFNAAKSILNIIPIALLSGSVKPSITFKDRLNNIVEFNSGQEIVIVGSSAGYYLSEEPDISEVDKVIEGQLNQGFTVV